MACIHVNHHDGKSSGNNLRVYMSSDANWLTEFHKLIIFVVLNIYVNINHTIPIGGYLYPDGDLDIPIGDMGILMGDICIPIGRHVYPDWEICISRLDLCSPNRGYQWAHLGNL